MKEQEKQIIKQENKVYLCKLIKDSGYGSYLTLQEACIEAINEDDARSIVCEEWQIRKNKKGLYIEEIEPKKGKIISKQELEPFTEEHFYVGIGLCNVESRQYETNYYCEHCGAVIVGKPKYCHRCGRVFE